MIIPATLPSSIPYIKANSLLKTGQAELSFSVIQAKISAVDESKNTTADSNGSGKYDLKNCTFEEFCSTIKTLAKEGKLTTHDILLSTADFERSLKQENPNFKYYITPADSAGRRNWVNEFQALADRQLKWGNALGCQRNMERKEVAMKALKLLNQSAAINLA
jgi:hypothetical protein